MRAALTVVRNGTFLKMELAVMFDSEGEAQHAEMKFKEGKGAMETGKAAIDIVFRDTVPVQ